MRRTAAAALTVLFGVVGAAGSASAEPPRSIRVDRVVVRWHAPELGGAARAQFVLERELAFEARVEALAANERSLETIDERYVRTALQRRIAETLLSRLPIRPQPTPKEVAQRAEAARSILEQRVGGREQLTLAREREGVTTEEFDALLRRSARASLYLDRMVAPLYEPTEVELRETHASGMTPFSGRPYAEVAEQLRRWLVAQRLNQALDAFFQRARSRVTIAVAR